MLHRFLSTLSLRRATILGRAEAARRMLFLSTLSLRRATRPPGKQNTLITDFYPRSPCGERPTATHFCAACTIFLSTLSLRRATCVAAHQTATEWNFYPRSPCGERRLKATAQAAKWQFLSTLSLRRATRQRNKLLHGGYISIHALLAESDFNFGKTFHAFPLFLSTLSLRRATVILR